MAAGPRVTGIVPGVERVVDSRKIAEMVADPSFVTDLVAWSVAGLAYIYSTMKIHLVAAGSRCIFLRRDV
jgi:hypothetical protein